MDKNNFVWSQKIPAILAYCGGVGNITKRYLARSAKLEEFQKINDDEWRRIFNETLNGENISFALPSFAFPDNGGRLQCLSGLFYFISWAK